MTHLWIAFLILFATADEAPVRGRLCVGEKKAPMKECSNVTGLTFAVTPADRERLFVWTSADESTAQIGVIPAKAETLDLGAAPVARVAVRIAGDPSRGWPADVEVIVGRENQWIWTIGAKSIERLRTLVVPRNDAYMLGLKAARHRLQRRQIPAREEQVTVGEVRLAPLPVVRARVVDVEGKPIASANVMRPDGSHCASANEQGVVVCEIAEPVPEVMVVGDSGYAPQELRVPRDAGNDGSEQTITLAAGRKVTAKVIRPEAGTARVTLYGRSKVRHEPVEIKTHEIKEREEEVRFDAGKGEYFIVVEGSDALERLEVPIKIDDADVSETITVTPFRVIGSIRFGEDPIVDGTIALSPAGQTWRAKLQVKDGAFTATLWQRGEMTAAVNSEQLGVVEFMQSPDTLGATDPSHWDIRIAKRQILGRVLDAETKRPVPNATMSLTAHMNNSKMYTSVKIAPDGSYKILAKPGTYSLRVTSRDHVPYMIDVPVAAEDALKTIDIALERGIVQELHIVSATGEPLANAHVLEGIQPDRHNPQFINRADARGHFAVRGQPGQARVIYVVPQSGSFAVVRLQMPRTAADAKPLQVVVAPPAGSLRVRVVDQNGKPSYGGLLYRHNGEFIPFAIARFVDGAGGRREGDEVVWSRLPAGTYELWAHSKRDEEEGLIAGGGTQRPPIRVGLAGGEQTVTVTVNR